MALVRSFELTWKLSFPPRDVGYCTVQSYDPSPAVSARFVTKTMDGGKTWSEVPLIDDQEVREFGVAFLDENIGCVGAIPHGFGTTDGGKTWSKVEFGTAVNKIRLIRSDAGVTGYWDSVPQKENAKHPYLRFYSEFGSRLECRLFFEGERLIAAEFNGRFIQIGRSASGPFFSLPLKYRKMVSLFGEPNSIFQRHFGI